MPVQHSDLSEPPVTTASSATQSPYTHAEDLAAEITELSAYLYAATYRLLVLIHEFDRNNCWEYLGMASCAHWLNFKCGIGIHAAREKVRVANALAELPEMSERFKRGELSYSKVRAMTRIANEENEDYLLGIAKHGTRPTTSRDWSPSTEAANASKTTKMPMKPTRNANCNATTTPMIAWSFTAGFRQRRVH